MFAITDRAGAALQVILDQLHATEDKCIRFELSPPPEGLRIDREQVGDEVVVHEGRKVLVIDPYTAETCAQQTLDCDGRSFVLFGPGF